MRLTLVNVGVLGPGTRVIELKKGLNALIGPNGAGKSTAFAAFYYAVTGETISGINIADMITWGSPEMTVTLESDGMVLKRTVNNKGVSKHSLQLNGKTITKRTDIDAALSTIFGISDMHIMRHVFFAEQFKVSEVLDCTNSERLSRLQYMIGLSHLEHIRDVIKTGIDSIDHEVIPAEVINSLKDSAEAALRRRDDCQERLASYRSSILSAEEENSLRAIVSSPLKGTLSDLSAKREAAAAQAAELKAIVDNPPQMPTKEECDQYTAYTNAARLSAEVDTLRREVEQLSSVQVLASSAINGFISAASTELGSLKSKRDSIITNSKLLQEGKCPLINAAPCPELLAATDPESVAAQLSDIDANIENVKADIESMTSAMQDSLTHEKRLASSTERLGQLERQLAAYEGQLEGFDVEAYEAKVDSASTRSAYDQAVVSYTRLDSMIQNIDAELEKLNGLVEYTQEEKDSATDKLQKSNTAKSLLETESSRLSEAEAEVSSTADAYNLAMARVETINRNKRKIDILTSVRAVLHRDNLPRQLMLSMLAAVNKKINYILSKFDFPYEVLWEQSGQISYRSPDSESLHNVGMLSGGQKYVVAVAFRCALLEILNVKFNMLALDEPTTGLDEANRDALSKCLTALTESYPDLYLLVPTHDERLLPNANIIEL